MRKFVLSVIGLLTLSSSAWAFDSYQAAQEQAYWQQRWADMYEAQQEAIYEAQIQQQLDMLAARQQYIEELLQQND